MLPVLAESSRCGLKQDFTCLLRLISGEWMAVACRSACGTSLLFPERCKLWTVERAGAAATQISGSNEFLQPQISLRKRSCASRYTYMSHGKELATRLPGEIWGRGDSIVRNCGSPRVSTVFCLVFFVSANACQPSGPVSAVARLLCFRKVFDRTDAHARTYHENAQLLVKLSEHWHNR